MPSANRTFSAKKVETHQEDMMLAGMIMSEMFLRQISLMYRPELIRSKYVRIVADWCVVYFSKYETNPGMDIEHYYQAAQRESMDDADAEAIRLFLESLNGRVEKGAYENFNVEYALDEVVTYFKKRSLEILKEDLDYCLENENLTEAENKIGSYGVVSRIKGTSANPLVDENVLRKAFESKEPLYTFPGAYGELVNEYLIREGFIGIMGPEKGTKSWHLIDHAMAAMANRLNVAFITGGDMNISELSLRMAIYNSGRSNKAKYCGSMQMPCLDCVKNQNGTCRLTKRKGKVSLLDKNGDKKEPVPQDYVPCDVCADNPGFMGSVWYTTTPAVEPLTWPEAKQMNEWFWKVRMKKRLLKMEFYPSETVNVAEIDGLLTNWSYMENWVPDVVIIDYADILKREPGLSGVSERDAQNHRWMALRRLSQEWHCLVITATQTDAASYENGLLLRRNFSEDKRKYGHSTVTIGLNQTPQEKEKKLNRKNVIMAREGDYNPYKTVTCLECIQKGRVILDSFWTPKEEGDE